MEFRKIGGHTFCPELLSDGVIIDVGCRGWVFTSAKEFIGKKIYCIDPDPKVFEIIPFHLMNLNPPIESWTVAISDKKGDGFIYLNKSCPEGTVLKEFDTDKNHPFTPCKTITMDDLYEITGTNVDILKLDCEGAEYMILGETFKPIPKQISVEFHFHTIPEIHNKHIDGIFERLSKDYEVFNKVWAEDNGSGFNYWDVLFIRKDLL